MISEIGLEAALASGAGAVELVPCDTEGLVRVADILRRHAEVLLDAGGWSLSCVEVTSWRGPASEGFWSVIEVEAARWRSAAEAFRSGALAVNGFVAAVAPARDVAAQAVTVYRAYEGAMAAATALADPGVPAVLPLLASASGSRRCSAPRRQRAQDWSERRRPCGVTRSRCWPPLAPGWRPRVT